MNGPYITGKLFATKEGVEQLIVENNQLRGENERLVSLLDKTRDDLLMRANEDSAGMKVVNLSDFIWQDIKDTVKAAKEGSKTL